MNRKTFVKLASSAALGATLGFPGMMSARANRKTSIHVFSKHLQFLGYENMAKTAKEIGFDGVDLTVRPKGHVAPENVEKDLPAAAKAIKKAGLQLDMMTTGITRADHPLTESILKTASKLGVKYYRMGSLKYDHSISMPENIEKMKPQFKALEQMNKHYGIKGAYQNHAGARVGAPIWDLHLLTEGLDKNWLGIQYDIKHGTAEGGRAWPLALRLIHDRIHTLDMKDFIWSKETGKWKEKYVPIGEGMVDYPAFLKLLKEYQVFVPMSMHFEYPLGGADHGHRELTIPASEVIAAMKRDLNKLRELLDEAGFG